jgi:hypothetical protein
MYICDNKTNQRAQKKSPPPQQISIYQSVTNFLGIKCVIFCYY